MTLEMTGVNMSGFLGGRVTSITDQFRYTFPIDFGGLAVL